MMTKVALHHCNKNSCRKSYLNITVKIISSVIFNQQAIASIIHQQERI